MEASRAAQSRRSTVLDREPIAQGKGCPVHQDRGPIQDLPVESDRLKRLNQMVFAMPPENESSTTQIAANG
jgi:hypothetical protein